MLTALLGKAAAGLLNDCVSLAFVLKKDMLLLLPFQVESNCHGNHPPFGPCGPGTCMHQLFPCQCHSSWPHRWWTCGSTHPQRCLVFVVLRLLPHSPCCCRQAQQVPVQIPSCQIERRMVFHICRNVFRNVFRIGSCTDYDGAPTGRILVHPDFSTWTASYVVRHPDPKRHCYAFRPVISLVKLGDPMD